MARKISSSVKKGLKLKVRESHVFRVCRSYLGKTEREEVLTCSGQQGARENDVGSAFTL